MNNKNKVFKGCFIGDVEELRGWTILEILGGINAEQSGIHVKAIKQIENVTIAREFNYDPTNHMEECSISDEYILEIAPKTVKL